jgi:HK97 family phage major capsid protein
MMHDDSLKAIRKLKDSTGRPLFLPGYDGMAGSMADTLLGRPIYINQHVATMAANAKSILCGDFSRYIVRDALDIQMHRFTDSAYAKKGQVGFLAFSRHGGVLADVGGSIKYYQNSAT